ncbi:MAG: TetR/AcrR family transcriptional regulator [Actinobacteria bacterium]|nr:MAG: TetR/AcrR family transcriptional regulator [Actinomycetota bacterium]
MTPATPTLRSDARRNRQRILVAAAEVFAEGGVDAQMTDIAARAGVGIGTLYRHYSTKEELIYAVVNAWFEDLLTATEEAAEIADPATSFRTFFAEMCARVASAATLARALHTPFTTMPRPVPAERRVMEIMRELVDRAQVAGALRRDIVADDLPPLLATIAEASHDDFYAHRQWQRYMELILDGLCSATPSPLTRRT